MQTQTPRRAEDYLQDLQATVRVSSPVSHVLQEGRADIHQVLREHYTLPDSLPSSDRDQGYATSSNSEVYAPGIYGEGQLVGADYQEPVYQLNLDGLADALPIAQEARTRHRLSQFSMPDLSLVPDTPVSDKQSGLSSCARSRSGSDKNISVHYASVNITHDLQNSVGNPSSGQATSPTDPCMNFYGDLAPLYCQARPSSVRSFPELPNVGLEPRGFSPVGRVPAAALALPDEHKMNPISRPHRHHLGGAQPNSYPRSQSFEGRPGVLMGPPRHARSRDTDGETMGRFPYAQYEDRCSTCSSSSDSDDWCYDWSRPPGSKISYVDDMGIGGMNARVHTLPTRGRRHKKNKQCVIS